MLNFKLNIRLRWIWRIRQSFTIVSRYLKYFWMFFFFVIKITECWKPDWINNKIEIFFKFFSLQLSNHIQTPPFKIVTHADMKIKQMQLFSKNEMLNSNIDYNIIQHFPGLIFQFTFKWIKIEGNAWWTWREKSYMISIFSCLENLSNSITDKFKIDKK